MAKEEKCKYYSLSELRSHVAKSYYEDYRTLDTIFCFNEEVKMVMPNMLFKELCKKYVPVVLMNSVIGFHPDGFWFILFKDQVLWSERPITLERPQLTRYNALTMRGED